MRCTKPGWWVALAALVALAATAAGQVADGAPLALEVQLWQTRLSAEAGGKLPADAPATLAALRSRAEDAATAAEQALCLNGKPCPAALARRPARAPWHWQTWAPPPPGPAALCSAAHAGTGCFAP